MPLMGDSPWQEPCLKVAKVGRLGSTKMTASWREWIAQKAMRSGLQMFLFTLVIKMIESPASCQRARMVERL